MQAENPTANTERQDNSESELPQPYFQVQDRKLRIFFSVDVAGSTHYKSQHASYEQGDHWSRFYDNFFGDFSSRFLAAADNYAPESSKGWSDVSVWKLLGDEILFTAVVHNLSGVFLLTKAFYRVLCELDEYYYRSKFFLRLKGTAWTAGFPIRNMEIQPRKGLLDRPDFIGPDLDIGFRLCKMSRAGRLTVSHDLADLLAQTMDHDRFFFHHVGWEVLQGVFNDKPYPVFWVTTGKNPYILPWEELQCSFTKKYKDGAEIEQEELRQLIQQVREALPMLRLFQPYFSGDTMPQHHDEIWKGLEKQISQKEGMGTLDMGSDEN